MLSLVAAAFVAVLMAVALLVPAVLGGGAATTAAGAPVSLGRTEPVLGSILFPPAVPQGLAVTPGDRSLAVRWDPVTSANLAEYRVYLDGATWPRECRRARPRRP